MVGLAVAPPRFVHWVTSAFKRSPDGGDEDEPPTVELCAVVGQASEGSGVHYCAFPERDINQLQAEQSARLVDGFVRQSRRQRGILQGEEDASVRCGWIRASVSSPAQLEPAPRTESSGPKPTTIR
jgi:hypothetical protein